MLSGRTVEVSATAGTVLRDIKAKAAWVWSLGSRGQFLAFSRVQGLGLGFGVGGLGFREKVPSGQYTANRSVLS